MSEITFGNSFWNQWHIQVIVLPGEWGLRAMPPARVQGPESPSWSSLLVHSVES